MAEDLGWPASTGSFGSHSPKIPVTSSFKRASRSFSIGQGLHSSQLRLGRPQSRFARQRAKSECPLPPDARGHAVMISESRLNAARRCAQAVAQMPVTVRPIMPRDAPNLQSYVRRLSRESRHNRFLGGLNELSPRELERLSHAEQTGTHVLIAELEVEDDLQIIGEAPYAAMDDAATYEFAISVADEWQRRGIGTRMVQLIEQQVASLGARSLVADALQSNQAARGLARRVGFIITGNPRDARLVRLSKSIDAGCSRQPSSFATELQVTASCAL